MEEAERIKAEAEHRVRELRAVAVEAGASARVVPLLWADFRTVAEAKLSLMPNPQTRFKNEQLLKRHVFPMIGNKQMRSITSDDIARCILSWTKPAESTRATIYRTLSPVFTYAVEQRIRADNPLKDSTVKNVKPSEPKKKIPVWDRDLVLGVCNGIRKDVSILPLVAAFCGLRQAEAFGLSPDDIGFNEQGKRVIRVTRQVLTGRNGRYFAPPKHKKSDDDPREVPVPDFVWKAIQAFAQDYPPFPVTLPFNKGDRSEPKLTTVKLYLVTGMHGAWEPAYFNRATWYPVLHEVGIEKKRSNGTHALRHWFAANQLRNGTEVTRLSDYLGHHDPAFTLRRYGRFGSVSTDANKKIDEEWTGLLGG
jgi:integrase